MKTRFELAIGVLFCTFSLSTSAKVLVLLHNINSHIFYHSKIARLLADEGHQVDIILNSYVKVPDVLKGSRVRILRFQIEPEVVKDDVAELSNLIVDSLLAKSSFDKKRTQIALYDYFMTASDVECEFLLNDNELRRQTDAVNYDVAIMDSLGLNCHSAFIYNRTEIRTILLGGIIFDSLLRIPALPSFVPLIHSTMDDQMDFFGRWRNTANFVIQLVRLYLTGPMASLGGVPPRYFSDIVSNSSMFFPVDDIAIAYPKPSMPNIIPIGDALPEEGKPLGADLAEFVRDAKEGVIVASFGSYFDLLPADIVVKFCSVFKRIPQKVIWKLKNRTSCNADPSKVLMLDWVPQNDLLSDRNVKLFISHCGISSFLESVYHATPILAAPVSIDQPYHAKRIESLGLGYQIKLIDFSVAEMIAKISRILSDENVSRNVKRASYLLRNKPDTPGKRVSYWVQYLATYGDGHLKSNAFRLNIFQFYCMDILFTLLAMVIVISTLCVCCLKSAFRCLASRRLSKKAKTE